jgi:hypothetical protein
MALVAEINGKVWTDFSQEGVEEGIKELDEQGVSQGHVEHYLDELKKKLTASFDPVFLINTETERLSM